MPPKKTVMVVDDEECILVLLKELLEGEGFNVITASSGMECLDKLESVKPDLLMLDIMMSRITGLDVAEAVRLDPSLKDTKIIFMTVVKSREVNPALLKKLDAMDYITKPFDNADLVRRVKWAVMKSG